MSVEDCKALMIIKNTTSKVDGHYHVGYFGGRKNHTYPLTKPAAEARLQGLKKRFHWDPTLETKYRAVIDDCGCARKLNKEEAVKRSSFTWHLPHHPLFNVNKPNKVRVVFDTAARFNGTSLNDQLY